ncbi:helix-turn-helix domain-containing protein [Nocardioides marmoriginsengisoli]
MRLTSEHALASAVRAARKEAGLSQQEVADRAGMSRVWVARLEGGEANVTLDSLLRVASVLGMSLDATWNPQQAADRTLPKKRTLKRPSTTAADSKTVVATGKVTLTESKPHSAKSGAPVGSVKGSRMPQPRSSKAMSAHRVNLDDVLSRVTKQ